jgi:hypothetical protein
VRATPLGSLNTAIRPSGDRQTVEHRGAGNSSLQCDAGSDQYTYVWKTDKAWAKTCRILVLTLNETVSIGRTSISRNSA